MEIIRNNKFVKLIGGILFSVLALMSLISIRIGSLGFGTGIALSLLWTLCFGVAAFAMFSDRRRLPAEAAFGGMVILEIISIIIGVKAGVYNSYMWSYFYAEETGFNIIYMIPSVITLVVFGMMTFGAVAYRTNDEGEENRIIRLLWFLPAALTVAALLISAFIFLGSNVVGLYWNGAYWWISPGSILRQLIAAGAFLFAAYWIVNSEKIAASETEEGYKTVKNGEFDYERYGRYDKYKNSTEFSASQKEEFKKTAPLNASKYTYGFCDMVMHVILLLFTFGIWYFVWIYRTTERLNGIEGESDRNPVTKLLLCIFVPFYSLYWIYKSAQRIDKIGRTEGIDSDTDVLCLLLAIFAWIAAPVLMQYKINEIAQKKSETGCETTKGFASEDCADINEENAADHGENISGFAYDLNREDGENLYNDEILHKDDRTFCMSEERESSVDNEITEKTNTVPQQNPPVKTVPVYGVPEELKKYKELLDMEIITKEEFEMKKKQLLGI